MTLKLLAPLTDKDAARLNKAYPLFRNFAIGDKLKGNFVGPFDVKDRDAFNRLTPLFRKFLLGDIVGFSECPSGDFLDREIARINRMSPLFVEFEVGQRIAEACNLDIDYTNSGADRAMSMPSDVFDTPSNLKPITDSSPDTSIRIGDFQWWSTGVIAAGGFCSFIDAAEASVAPGSTYGAAVWNIAIEGGGNWAAVAGPSKDGLQSFLLPRLGNGDSLGGFVPYYFNSAAWAKAFVGNSASVVMAQNGSVYKTSISVVNLVVDVFGNVGAAGI